MKKSAKQAKQAVKQNNWKSVYKRKVEIAIISQYE